MASTVRTAIVTGASRGLGKAMAMRLAADGMKVVVNYFPALAEEAEQVVKEIRDQWGEAIAIGADVSNFEEVDQMVKQCIEHFGSIDVLVNNAQAYRATRVQNLSNEDWHLVVESGLTGAFYNIKCVVPYMLQQGYGRIINISSGSGLHGFQGDSAYSATKAGIIGMSKALTKEMASKGVLVNVVVPGLIPTDLMASLPEKSIEQMINMIPMRRMGTPEEVAQVVSFLASESTYIAGQVICVDGGLNI